MKKTFDCVELQHQGGKKVQEKISSMTVDEQIAYWERRKKELQKKQTATSVRKKAS